MIVDAATLNVLAQFFPLCCNLCALGFSGSEDLEDETFLSLVQLCPSSLQHLDISNCVSLTDDIAVAFLNEKNLASLRTVNISGKELSDYFLLAFFASAACK